MSLFTDAERVEISNLVRDAVRGYLTTGAMPGLPPDAHFHRRTLGNVAIWFDSEEKADTSAPTYAAGVVTATKTNHGLQVGDYVRRSGAVETEYNGWFRVDSVPTSSTYTYAISGTPSSPATGTTVEDLRVVERFSWGLEKIGSGGVVDVGTGNLRIVWANTQAETDYRAYGIGINPSNAEPINLTLKGGSTTTIEIVRWDTVAAGLADGRGFIEFAGID